eukprot:11215445-Karenia_brevis.AAC.1
MVKILAKMNKKKSGDSRGSEDSEHRGKAKSFDEVHKMRRKLRRHPKKFSKKFRAMVKKELSIRSDPQAWSYAEWAKKQLTLFGKMRGLWKALYAMSEILEMVEAGQVDLAHAALGQTMKAMVQVALDKGSWDNAVLLLPWTDPTSRVEWGGDEREN